MLSVTLKRALLETRSQLPPTFLLPWAASLSTVSAATPTPAEPPPSSPRPSSALPPPTPASSGLSSSVRELLPLMRSQSPHYATLHVHGHPYLLTQGDTLRLPFLMHGVEPGDILRLNRAVNLGSRDYTLKPPAASPKLKSPTTSPTTPTHPPDTPSSLQAPHFIPHIAKGKHSYIDDTLFVCRAVVMGVESEPLRIKEKTKRRQRHVRKVKSKHRFTILRISELRIKSVEEIQGQVE